ncbi:folate-binding protein YgfZ [Egicoccus sp. AB-alg6-2]|uniref:CAF17-like 4Fe-4S cluster assembly/insertion protein YgfZ n=1 Tax=Egicoccus sp. AB-alg6-2 TaxID=3242692 RepID=UPI00359E5A37
MAIVFPLDLRRIEVSGDDRVRYLEDVTSQALASAQPGTVHGALYLDVHGAPLAMFDVAVLPDRLALLVPAAAVDTVVDQLGGRTFLLDARFVATEDVVVALRDDEDGAVAAAAGLRAREGRCHPGGDVLVIGRADGVDVVGPAGAVDEAVTALVAAGARHGDARDAERWRIGAGQPAWGVEVAAPHLPEELGLLPTHVHLAKGCYPGQEAVARMWMLGRPRRRLARVRVHGAVEPGFEVGEGRRRVQVTSVSPDGDRALAFVPGDAEVGARFPDEVDAPQAIEVEALVGDTAYPPGADPQVTRRRDRR